MNPLPNQARPTIVDGHCHVASTMFIPEQFLADVADNMYVKFAAVGQPIARTKLVDMVIRQHQDHQADQLVAEMDAAGIDRAVLLAPDFATVMRCELDLDEIARRHHEIRLRHPGRFHVFMGIDPRRGREGVDAFERYVDQFGFEGLKLYPPCGFSASDRRLDDLYEICAARGLPVLLHTGPTVQSLDFNFIHPGLIDEAARRFENVNFILAHGAVAYVREAAYMCQYRANVYMDTGGITGGMHPEGWKRLAAEALGLGIRHKLIFGSDWPISRMSGGLEKMLKELHTNPELLPTLSAKERSRFLSGTIGKLLERSLSAVQPALVHG